MEREGTIAGRKEREFGDALAGSQGAPGSGRLGLSRDVLRGDACYDRRLPLVLPLPLWGLADLRRRHLRACATYARSVLLTACTVRW